MNQINFIKLQNSLIEIEGALEDGRDPLPLYAPSHDQVVYEESFLVTYYKVEKSVRRILNHYLPKSFWDYLPLQTQQVNVIPKEHYSVEEVLRYIISELFNNAVLDTYNMRQIRMRNHIWQIDQMYKDGEEAKQRDRYSEYLSKELQGSNLNFLDYLHKFEERKKIILANDEERNLNHTIVNFHHATHRFWLLFMKNNQREIDLRKRLMPFVNPSSFITDRPLFKALRKELKWREMEAKLNHSVPVTLFAKLHDAKNLTDEENYKLQFWVESLNQNEDITPNFFSKILQDIVHVIEIQGSLQTTLEDILFWLDQQGCQLLHKRDHTHLKWRGRLQLDSIIECNGKKLILGQQLSPQKNVNQMYKDNNKVFELKNFPDYVVKIAQNRICLLLEQKKAQFEEEHCGFRLVERIENLESDPQKFPVDGLDKQGRCVVLEKLSSPLNKHDWKSQDYQLTAEDEKIALVLACHIYCMNIWDYTAGNVSLDQLMWNKKGVLKTTRLFKKEPSNYNTLENYCLIASKQNPYILSFLINVSKLSEHSIAVYYQKAITYTLKEGKTNLIGSPIPKEHRHNQDIYEKHIKHLCDEAIQLRTNCIELVMNYYLESGFPDWDQDMLKGSIITKLVEYYASSLMPGQVSMDLANKVYLSFSSPPQQNMQMNKVFNKQAYYRENHERMIKYNKALMQSK